MTSTKGKRQPPDKSGRKKDDFWSKVRKPVPPPSHPFKEKKKPEPRIVIEEEDE